MEEAAVAILEAQINRQSQEIEKIYLKIQQRSIKLDKEPAVESLAYQLHNLYCAYEDLFKVIAARFENNIKNEAGWHRELLQRMSLEISGIRPAFISTESEPFFAELKNFRHFFRHAYGYELDAGKVKLVLKGALRLRRLFKKDADVFLRKLKKL